MGILYALEPLLTVIFVINMNIVWEKVMSTLRAQVFGRILIQKVYLNAVALLLRLCVRDELDIVGDRFKHWRKGTRFNWRKGVGKPMKWKVETNIWIFGGKVAELPLVGTRLQYRRLGMCRILMDTLEKNLKQLGVERLVLPAVPDVLKTWTNAFGFARMTNNERSQFLEYAFLDFLGTIMCQKLLTRISSPEFGLTGGIILAPEGINGSICGTRESVEKVLAFMQNDVPLKGLRRNESPVSPEEEAIHHGQHGHSASSPLAAGEDAPFRWDHVRVKLKKEIVTLGMPTISPIERGGKYVSPKE